MNGTTPEPLFSDHLLEVRRRMDRALESAGFDGVLIPSGLPPLQFADDQTYPFKPTAYFRQWVPDAWPGCFLAYQPGRRPRLFFHQPVDYWYQPPAVPDAPWIGEYDLCVLREPAEIRDQLAANGRWVTLGPDDPAWDRLGEPNPPSFVAELDYARAAKTPWEIECLARASCSGARAHRAAERAFRAGASEFEIQLEFCRAAGAREEELPYNSIIAFGRHAAVLHYQHLERTPAATRGSFLIDAGVACSGYACDITRTHAAAAGEFADLVAAVDLAQQALAGRVVPGQDFREIHLAAHVAVAGVLADFGLIRTTADVAAEAGLTSVFFPHGIGHLLGLQVHDVGGLMADATGRERPRPPGHPYLRLTRDLAPGFVVTIEPGLYFIDPLLEAAAADGRRKLLDWGRVEALRPFGGVRIEDNVVALADGPRNLTREAFAAVDAESRSG